MGGKLYRGDNWAEEREVTIFWILWASELRFLEFLGWVSAVQFFFFQALSFSEPISFFYFLGERRSVQFVGKKNVTQPYLSATALATGKAWCNFENLEKMLMQYIIVLVLQSHSEI